MKDSEAVQRLYKQQRDLANTSQKIVEEGFWMPLSAAKESVNGRRNCTLKVDTYLKEVVCRDLVLQCVVDTVMEIALPEKIVVSASSKRAIQDKKQVIVGLAALKMISGQKSQPTWARKSIAAFKLREGSVIGCKVTMRGKAMYSFLDKMIFLVLPRARPSLLHQGIDANTNFNIGVGDPFIFVELEGHFDLFQSFQGIDIALVTSAKQKSVLQLLLSGLQIKV